MKPAAVLLTQCLQNDFVKPVAAHESLPNLLHVGHDESRRLLGEDPARGPVAQVMEWAHSRPDDELALVHVRDGHDPDDPRQAEHLARFGVHCVLGTEGAAFAFPDPPAARGERPDKRVAIVDSPGLNDFEGTELAAVLAPHLVPPPGGRPRRVGLIGVWTEAKVSFLAYELRTRYPDLELAVSSALTASSSRAAHFLALDRLQRLLGVEVLPSVGSFVAWLGGDPAGVPLPVARSAHPEVRYLTGGDGDTDDTGADGDGAGPAPVDRELVRYLFRDCRSVEVRPLAGGFSGNLVFATRSVDLHGHEQVPHVVKIGERDAIGREREAFERVEAVLGNAAPRVADFADHGERGGLKYRYASMGGGATTFKSLYEAGAPAAEVERILRTVFGEQLGRLYAAATLEPCDLLGYYAFEPRWAPSVREKVEAILGGPAPGETIVVAGREVWNPCRFYERSLGEPARLRADRTHLAFVHGDLNGANIIRDGRGNVWLIDFFHTHRGHVLRDLIKLENDLLFLFTALPDDETLAEALTLSDHLAAIEDLAAPLPAASALPGGGPTAPSLRRAWETVRVLRSFYPDLVGSDRDPYQLRVGQLRYAVHTLGFDEADERQKRWALYASGHAARGVHERLAGARTLRLDWLPADGGGADRLATTLLPGRRDHGRSLTDDLAVLEAGGITHVVCLVPVDELDAYGVPDLLERYAGRGLAVLHRPIPDQKACGPEEMAATVRWIERALGGGGRVLVHCVGGLGRAGTVAACVLRARGLDADAALATVRATRSPRAVETAVQEALVRSFSG